MKKTVRLAERGKKVLFLCFSNNLEEYIRERLSGFPDVKVATFHSFALSVLADFVASVTKSSAREFLRLLSEIFRRVPARRHEEFAPSDFAPNPAEAKALLRRFAALDEGIDFGGILDAYREKSGLDPVLISVLGALLPSGQGGVAGRSRFFSERLPKALREIFEEYSLRAQFAAILIDEAQDFEDNWCDCILALFKNRQDRIIYIFYDDNQSIFQGIGDLPVVRLVAGRGLGNFIFHLRKNMRNTQEIHDYAVRVTGLGTTSYSMDIRGLEPEESVFRSSEDVRHYVGKLLHDLIAVHGLSASAITILCNVPLGASPFGHFPTIGGFTLAPEGGLAKKTDVAFRTVSQFKGLETDVAVVVLDYAAPVEEVHHGITRNCSMSPSPGRSTCSMSSN